MNWYCIAPAQVHFVRGGMDRYSDRIVAGHRDASNTFEREWGESNEIGRILTNEMTVAS